MGPEEPDCSASKHPRKAKNTWIGGQVKGGKSTGGIDLIKLENIFFWGADRQV
jgi:hypothetical protein